MDNFLRQLEDGGDFHDMQNLKFLNQLDNHLTLEQWLKTYLRLPYHEYTEGEREPDIACLRLILENTGPEVRYKILADTKGRFKGTFAQRAAYYKHCNVLSCILNMLKQEERHEILQIQDEDGRTALHKAAWKGFTRPMEQMLESVPSDTYRYILLQIATYNGWTPLYWASMNRCVPMIKCILNSVNGLNIFRFQLARAQLVHGETALHLAAKHSYINVIWAILDSLQADDQKALLDVQDCHQKTAIDFAMEGQQTKAAQLLTAYQEGTDVFSLVLADNEFIERIQHVPVEYLTRLGPARTQYFVPSNGTILKNYALILFNAYGRLGADREADTMEHGLALAGCDVSKFEWCSISNLDEMLCETLQKLSDSCLSLIVCLMSHGGMGGVQGYGGNMMALNDIIIRIDQIICKDVPVVIILQACQGYNTAPREQDLNRDPAQVYMHRGDLSRDNRHICLRRPHTALLLATVSGGDAERGAYTEVLADTLAQSDGKTNITTIHTRAVNKLRHKYGDNQTPELRHTLVAELMLPGELE